MLEATPCPSARALSPPGTHLWEGAQEQVFIKSSMRVVTACNAQGLTPASSSKRSPTRRALSPATKLLCAISAEKAAGEPLPFHPRSSRGDLPSLPALPKPQPPGHRPWHRPRVMPPLREGQFQPSSRRRSRSSANTGGPVPCCWQQTRQAGKPRRRRRCSRTALGRTAADLLNPASPEPEMGGREGRR